MSVAVYQVPRVVAGPQAAQPQQVPVITPGYGYYGWGYYSYAPMFIDLMFAMLFLVLPFMMIIPLFKAIAGALK